MEEYQCPFSGHIFSRPLYSGWEEVTGKCQIKEKYEYSPYEPRQGEKDVYSGQPHYSSVWGKYFYEEVGHGSVDNELHFVSENGYKPLIIRSDGLWFFTVNGPSMAYPTLDAYNKETF